MTDDRILRIARELTELKLAQSAAPRQIERRQVDLVIERLLQPEPSRAVLMDGPRRSGKSTILFHVLARLRESDGPLRPILYLDLEDARLGPVTVRDTVAALLQTADLQDRPVILLDEVHNAVEWWRDVKVCVDHTPRLRLVIADSCAAIVQARARESLVGRCDAIPVHPFSLPEWWELRAKRGIPSPSGLERIASVHDYLEAGGFPEHATQGNLARTHELLRKDVVSQVARRDLASVHGLRHGQSIEQLLVARLAQYGSKLSNRDMAASIHASERSIRDWRRAFLDTGLVWELPPWVRSAGKFARRQPKLYAVDPGLVAACSMPVFGGSQDAGHLGRLLETAVAQALRVHVERVGGRLSFYSANGGRTGEVDFVCEVDGFTALVEVTAGDGAKKPSSLARHARQIDADWAGVVALRAVSETVEVDGRTLPMVPAHEFLDLLGRGRTEEIGWPA